MRKALVVLAALALGVLFAPSAQAAAFTGAVSPTIFGGLADLNGTGSVTAADSWAAFYGDTSIISGGLDCNAWTATNDGAQGDGTIDGADDCTLVGFDGTADGVTITVSNGHFAEHDGILIPDGFKLPTTFNASDPANPSVAAADFGWQVLGGRVDANGNSVIDDGDCSVGIANGWSILGVECGFNPPSTSADNGLIDTNGDFVITQADDSGSGFFGLEVLDGFVQAAPSGGGEGGGGGGGGGGVPPPPCTITGTSGADVLNGTTGNDVICARQGPDLIRAKAGDDVLKAGRGRDTLRGGPGNDLLRGGPGFDTCFGGKGFDTFVSCEK